MAAPGRPVARRRRWVAAGLAALGLAALGAGLAVGGRDSDAPTRAARAAAHPPPLPQLPGGGREIFPGHRVVAYYGAPGSAELGVLGIGSPDQVGRELRRRAAAYRRPGRPVLPAMELIATVATRSPARTGSTGAASPARSSRATWRRRGARGRC